MLEETAPFVTVVAANEDEAEATPLVFKHSQTSTTSSSQVEDPTPLQMILLEPSVPRAPTKRKRTGRTKSIAKRLKSKDLEA